MHRAVCTTLLSLSLSAPFVEAQVTTTVVRREQETSATAVVQRRTPPAVNSQTVVYSAASSASGITPDAQTTSSTANGSLTQGDQPIAGGSGSAAVTSVAAYSAGNLTSFSATGAVAWTVSTGSLAAYEPTIQSTEVAFQPLSVHTTRLNFTTVTPVNYTLSVKLSNNTGPGVGFSRLYLDVNNDGRFNAANGDVQLQSVTATANNTASVSGTLLPTVLGSQSYLVEFSANVFADTTTSDAQLSASTDFAHNFTLTPVPEPAGVVGLAVVAGVACRRLRRRTAEATA